jgi:4'-phosphopantetheinyl transferase
MTSDNPLLALPSNEIHLWITYPEEIQDEALLFCYEKLLSDAERAEQQGFRHIPYRRQYTISRSLVRSTLSRYAEIPPERWQFIRNEHGRPEILPDGETPPFRFNVSHTNGIAACVVALDGNIGVDVENVARDVAISPISRRYFSASEIKSLASLPAKEQRCRFFEIWTLKESFGKAMGLGLTFPLKQLSFNRVNISDWEIASDALYGEDSNRWRFWVYYPTPYHVLTVASGRSDPIAPILKIGQTFLGMPPHGGLQRGHLSIITKSNR